MRYEEASQPDYFYEDRSLPMITDRDLLNELKKPVETPDFAPVVLSRIHRAFPGLTGRAGRRQAWCWRIGTAASILIALVLSTHYGTSNRSQYAADREVLPAINDLVKSIQTHVDDADHTLNAVYSAAGEVASHLANNAQRSADSPIVPVSQDTALPSPSHSIFPVEPSYWSDADQPQLWPSPAAHDREQDQKNKETVGNLGEDDSSDQQREPSPVDPIPGSPKFAFSMTHHR